MSSADIPKSATGIRLSATALYLGPLLSAGARVLEQGGHGQFWGAHGERVEREPNGGLGAEPPAGSRGRAPGQEVRGAIRSPPEAESFLALRRATDRANLYPLQYFQQSITIR